MQTWLQQATDVCLISEWVVLSRTCSQQLLLGCPVTHLCERDMGGIQTCMLALATITWMKKAHVRGGASRVN